jgi:hypothetical protein
MAETTARFRSGVVVGGSVGVGLGQAAGYPNNVQDIGNPQKHSASGWLPGTSETLFVLGALTDYLSFGFWYSTAAFQDSDQHSSRWGVGLRVETFPLVRLYPRLEGLGGFASFGLGGGNLTTAQPGVPQAEGTQSFIGLGTFYEWAIGHVLGGHFAFGPSVEYDAVWSRPFEHNGLLASARVVFYGGP